MCIYMRILMNLIRLIANYPERAGYSFQVIKCNNFYKYTVYPIVTLLSKTTYK